MAQRRMFSQKIVGSDAFIDMPVSARELYFQLGMYSDDDGFINPKKIIRMIGASEDDLKILSAKRFVLPFENGVVVIKHWQINNMIRKDFYQPTIYLKEKSSLILKENKSYTENVNTMLTECLPNIIKLNKINTNKIADISEQDSPNLKDLYSKMGFPSKPKRIVSLWQDEASNAIKYFSDGETKASSVFKCFKDNEQKARIALSDCKELEKRSVMYFLKVFNEIKK